MGWAFHRTCARACTTHIITITGNLKPQTMQVLEDCLYLENIQEYVHDEDKIVSYSVVLFT